MWIALGAFAAPAAKVEFSVGDVTAQSADGRIRSLFKGAAVESGDTISTNAGRAQLRFTDGGYFSLYPGTTFRIDDYQWEGVSDGTERSLFSLLKGGLRTITGRVAKINRRAYQMTTVVATIGIRGTEYSMQLNGALRGAVAEGEIEVCNAGGCLAVAAGQGYLVRDSNTKPVLTSNQTLLGPPTPSTLQRNLLSDTSNVLPGTLGDTAGALTGTVEDLSDPLLGGVTGPLGGVTGTTSDGSLLNLLGL